MIGVDGQHLSTLGPQIGHVSNSPETGLLSLLGPIPGGRVAPPAMSIVD